MSFRPDESSPQRLIVFLQIVFCHGNRIESITLTAELDSALEECAIGCDQSP